MGLLVNGQWVDQWYDTDATGGEFKRESARFRHWLTRDGAPGAAGQGDFAAESGRYHLYVSLACPWAHRTLIFRRLKSLEPHIGVSVVHPHMLGQGWELRHDDGTSSDQLYQLRYLYQVYLKAASQYSGRVTVPVLWDKQRATIVSNESADIIRMFNEAFNHITGNDLDFYPPTLRPEIDALNVEIYETVNNGVYRAGFATSQEAYDTAFEALFTTFDRLDQRLSRQRYLTGAQVTEADWRLFTTLVRFDAVYFGHFKCNLRRIQDYPHLSGYLRDLYQHPGVADTVDFDHIKQHYYFSHDTINPTRIVPRGPALDLDAPHDRATLSSTKRA